jgi:beta-lactamase class A
MISNVPTNTYPQLSVHEQQTLKADLSTLMKDDIADQFKSPLLKNYIERIITKNERQKVTTDVSIIDLQTQKTIVGHKLDTEQFAASVNKLPVAQLVLIDLRAGKLSLDQVFTWQPSDVRGGAGVYDQPGAPTSATLEDVLFDLLNPSGNTAVRILVNYGLGGAASVNDRWQKELGLQRTYLQPLDTNRFYLGNTTSRESLQVLRQLLGTNDQYSRLVKNALATNIYKDYGVRSQLLGNDYIVLANKVGILDDVDGNNRHDVGIIYNMRNHKSYGYSFLNTAPGEAFNAPTAQAGASLADMGRGLLRFAGDKPTRQQAEQLLPFGASAQIPQIPEKKTLY